MANPLVAILALASPTLQDQVSQTRDSTARVYKFECEYKTVSLKGVVTSRKKLSAMYHTDEPKGRLKWTGVTVATASGAEGSFGEPKRQEFMEGFSYGWEDVANTGKPEFFKSIPPMQVECRNLVWDAHMFENFAHNFLAKMRLNEPVVISKEKESPLAESGSFFDQAVDVTWLGDSEWKGTTCALIRYRAYLNRFTYKLGNLPVEGSSDYWGEIWLAKRTGRIENATLYESVSVLMGTSKTPTRVFRVGSFERM